MSDKCWFPNGSDTQVNEDNSLSIQAPDNWIYVGYSGGELQVANDGGSTISCTCNTSGSCLPFTGSGPGGSTSGCAGDCTNCTMKQSIAQGDIDIDEGGYIDLNAEARIIKAEDNWGFYHCLGLPNSDDLNYCCAASDVFASNDYCQSL